MKKTVLIILLVIVSFSIKAQDLISGGANSWILHTPDDRTSLLVAPKTNSVWNWAKATQFYNNGNVSFMGNVGIGTANPEAKLVIRNKDNQGLNVLIDKALKGTWPAVEEKKTVTLQSSGVHVGNLAFANGNSETMRINTLGYVGIGTTTPSEKLEVNGNILLKDNLKFKYAGKKIEYHGDANHRAHVQLYNSSNGNIEIENVWSGGNADIVLKPDHNVVVSSGNVGIGTSNTFGYKLAVNGRIGAKEIKVEVDSPWPDYVFSKEYELPTLKEIEKHIEEKGHLPNIPSASEVKESKGIELGKMNAKLLQKIEELTLYTIQQEKEIQELKNQNKQLKKLAKEIALIKAKLK
ncbi:hypothetical protein [Tenacibaculum aiptasiae]|uniref:hypothetical protein n=1 Tax=Tenacibaculum aiptasiae TaxID=426481 RepID=UPI00232E3ED7|nr:hypothetical protein [Tenacibaculum aiptasiae]